MHHLIVLRSRFDHFKNMSAPLPEGKYLLAALFILANANSAAQLFNKPSFYTIISKRGKVKVNETLWLIMDLWNPTVAQGITETELEHA